VFALDGKHFLGDFKVRTRFTGLIAPTLALSVLLIACENCSAQSERIAVRDLTPGYVPVLFTDAQIQEQRMHRRQHLARVAQEAAARNESQPLAVRYDREQEDLPPVDATRPGNSQRVVNGGIETTSETRAINEASKASMETRLRTDVRADTGMKPGLQPNLEKPAIYNATGPQGAIPQIPMTPLR